MGMNLEAGGKPTKGVAPEMNVTPLVDVVLVLLIIFMVITPLLTKNFWIHTPKQEKEEIEKQDLTNDPNPPLVLRVDAAKAITVNGTTVELADLAPRLRRMFAARDDHVLFFDADDGVPYGFAVEVMDQAREGGAVTIATLTEAVAASAVAGSTGSP
jgi:biopolymer transport protein ExbD/biopolymer transport protein TolR